MYTFVQFIAPKILEAWFIENILEAWLTLKTIVVKENRQNLSIPFSQKWLP